MLAYLDALLAALAARDLMEIDRLLAHPLARILSPDALADATAERRAAATGTASTTPLRLFQLRYRTAQLLAESVVRADAPPAETPEAKPAAEPRIERRPQSPAAVPASAWADRRGAMRQQMELPLTA
jgi:hypothetical protein